MTQSHRPTTRRDLLFGLIFLIPLFLLTSGAVVDRVHDVFQGTHAQQPLRAP
ncbi:hypothetical protein [Conexibacter sp. CPCC 206217]|uniref:hypothetical protein n=1 Tax=Conexibacter sp. CPCC 206217 TaxID=3064574 RepID=UPI0027182C53|nr:hypothetical protein [Conexibacter sp. CPCC 206217]MDO8208859.1 hypothetical protein [Conexibacter sp. CPCC 206217]